ncbi:MAG: aspartate/tyrosine/aromatic aminotransferase [Planctomycetales bacterium]|nr:aspartate/tyrosine/aromatic aminotransferase [Planctomycetales bacterium]
MFENVEAAPPDAILGLTEAYRADRNPEKINLGVGVYQDERGRTPVLECVKTATKRLAAEVASKSYLPISGSPDYAAAVQALMFGKSHEIVESRRAVTAHTPGGTAAVRVAADFVHQNLPEATVWLSQPTWANHPAIFKAACVPTKTFPYLDKATGGLDYQAMMSALKNVPAGDVVLLHGCCHNPCGVDPTLEQWGEVASLLYSRGVLPLIDFAYQGFADGIEEDAAGLLEFCRPGQEFVVCNSFSKNFGLYRERVGGVTMVGADEGVAIDVASQVKRVIRSNYSNPPSHGGELVVTILHDADLREQWEQEVREMRDRINGMRSLLVKKLTEHGVPGDHASIQRQRGMFTILALDADHVERLRDDYAIYVVGGGRINVAGITPANVDRLCHAIAQVVK